MDHERARAWWAATLMAAPPHPEVSVVDAVVYDVGRLRRGGWACDEIVAASLAVRGGPAPAARAGAGATTRVELARFAAAMRSWGPSQLLFVPDQRPYWVGDAAFHPAVFQDAFAAAARHLAERARQPDR